MNKWDRRFVQITRVCGHKHGYASRKMRTKTSEIETIGGLSSTVFGDSHVDGACKQTREISIHSFDVFQNGST